MRRKMDLQRYGKAEDEAARIMQELYSEYDHMSGTDAYELAKLAQLNRIADALEELNGHFGNVVELLSGRE